MRALRSYLFAPGNNEDIIGKAFRAGADAIVLDLEDAVPESEKARARATARTALIKEGRAEAVPAYVRINSLASEHWRADVDAVLGPEVAGLRVPKVEDLASLCRLNDSIAAREKSLGLPEGRIRIIATIESARGLVRLEALARGPRVQGFTFGAADYVADIGAEAGDDTATLFARSRLVAISRSERLDPPVASVFTHLHDTEGLRADTLRQKALGFFGRSAIHPRQLPAIHAAFTPTAAEVSRAREDLSAFEAAGALGQGASQTEGRFIDLAVVRRARAILELHEDAADRVARKDAR
ncbi:MAG: CoA ester lyase [Vicinamibacteria bacterium]|nr:CoA ester lyase [Vicinamibacteria bacterium]